jgi:RNA polymerase sigma-70 factor (ECF subfamily)
MDEFPSMPTPAEPPENGGGVDFGALYEKFGRTLERLAARALPEALAARLDAADVVQEAFAAAGRRKGYFEAHPEVPAYFKLRTVLFQTLAGLERSHLGSARRDAFREVAGDAGDGALWEALPSGRTSPRSALAREERHGLLRAALEGLPEGDRQILVLRHFDGLGNGACAEVLGLSATAANARHVRALRRLKERLDALSEFRT